MAFSLKIDETYPEIMNQCVIMPRCINLLHIFTYKNQLELLEVAINNNCSFIRSSDGMTPVTLALDTKNKDCIKRLTKSIANLQDPNVLIRIEDDLIRMNKYATDSLVYFYKNSFKEPSEKLPKFAIPLKTPVNYSTSETRMVDHSAFLVTQSKDEIRSDRDELLNFKVSNFRLNYTLGSQGSIDFLVSIINCTEPDIFKTQFIQSILLYKWSNVQIMLAVQGSLYITFLILLSVYATLKSDQYILNPLLVLNFIFLIYEFLQMQVGFLDYFREFWNWADLQRIFLFIIYYTIAQFFSMSEQVNTIFLGLITFFTWARAIAYFRVFKKTRYLIRIIQDIFGAMIPFLSVLFYSIFTFALLFYTLNEYNPEITFQDT